MNEDLIVSIVIQMILNMLFINISGIRSFVWTKNNIGRESLPILFF